MSEFRLLIDGKLVPGAAELAVINPATEDVLAVAPRADRAQLDQAVASAKAAFPAWSKIPIRQRGALLVKLADAMEARKEEFIGLLTREQGKPLPESGFEVNRAIHHMRHVATMDLPLKVLKEDATQRVIQQHAPLGVVAAITPWNVPVLLLIVKTAPALLTGNTVVTQHR